MLGALKARLQDRRLLYISAAVALAIAIFGVGVSFFRDSAPSNDVKNAGFIMGGRAVTIHTDLVVNGRPATSAHVGDVLRFHMSIDPLVNLSANEIAALGDSISEGSMKPVLRIYNCGSDPVPDAKTVIDVPTSTPTDADLAGLDWSWTFSCNNTGTKVIEASVIDPTDNWDMDYQSFTNFAVVEPVEQRLIPILTACSALIAALAGLRGLSLGNKSTEKT